MKAKTICGLLAATALACAVSQAQAASERMTGFYAGGYGGYGWTDADLAGPDGDVYGGDYGILAGVEIGDFINKTAGTGFSAALQMHYGWSNASDTVGTTTIDKNHEWGVSFRPGLAFLSDTDEMGLKSYGILGWRRAEYNVTTAGASTENDFDGFDLGLGAEVMMNRNVGLRAEYTHVFYEQIGGMDPDEDNLRAGVAFHF